MSPWLWKASSRIYSASLHVCLEAHDPEALPKGISANRVRFSQGYLLCRCLKRWPSRAGEKKIAERRVWAVGHRHPPLGNIKIKSLEPGSLGPEVILHLVGLEMINSSAMLLSNLLKQDKLTWELCSLVQPDSWLLHQSGRTGSVNAAFAWPVLFC